MDTCGRSSSFVWSPAVKQFVCVRVLAGTGAWEKSFCGDWIGTQETLSREVGSGLCSVVLIILASSFFCRRPVPFRLGSSGSPGSALYASKISTQGRGISARGGERLARCDFCFVSVREAEVLGEPVRSAGCCACVGGSVVDREAWGCRLRA